MSKKVAKRQTAGQRALAALTTDPDRITLMTQAAFAVTEGLGTARLAEVILGQLTPTVYEH